MNSSYLTKFSNISKDTFFDKLDLQEREYVKDCAVKYLFSFQELRKICEIALDLWMWNETPLSEVWNNLEKDLISNENEQSAQRKKKLISFLDEYYSNLINSTKAYPKENKVESKQTSLICEEKEFSKNIWGDCPVCSDKTVCCGLKTLDAVQNCGFGCSYCTIQTFYGDSQKIHFVKNLRDNLAAIKLEPDKFYHIGTGQSSDSLMWGNRYGILDDLIDFAKNNKNILLEFKTKSANIDYFQDKEIPKNVVFSWSLNTEVIINNEEHFTASLDARLKAARKIADWGGRVAFHFHPMVDYLGAEEEYCELAKRVMSLFSPDEINFISYGTLTFIKPVIQQIRKRGEKTKILQMPMDYDPHGKLTYPLDIKLKLFKSIDSAFSDWKDKVFFYLCMERKEVWDALWGWHFNSRDEFLDRFSRCYPN